MKQGVAGSQAQRLRVAQKDCPDVGLRWTTKKLKPDLVERKGEAFDTRMNGVASGEISKRQWYLLPQRHWKGSLFLRENVGVVALVDALGIVTTFQLMSERRFFSPFGVIRESRPKKSFKVVSMKSADFIDINASLKEHVTIWQVATDKPLLNLQKR